MYTYFIVLLLPCLQDSKHRCMTQWHALAHTAFAIAIPSLLICINNYRYLNDTRTEKQVLHETCYYLDHPKHLSTCPVTIDPVNLSRIRPKLKLPVTRMTRQHSTADTALLSRYVRLFVPVNDYLARLLSSLSSALCEGYCG